MENNKAIWYNSEKNIWYIGSMSKIGGDIGSFYARRIPESGPDNEENLWNYLDDGWKADTGKDVSVRCTNQDCKLLEWSTCSKTCGPGQQTKIKGGRQCAVRYCNLEKCSGKTIEM